MQVYLDIDGVMVVANSWRRPHILDDGFPKFSAKSTAALNYLLTKIDAEIFLTTSHKHLYSVADWKNIFKNRNVHLTSIVKLPVNKKMLNRKDELLFWFRNNPPKEKFLIIDDDKTLNGLPNIYKSHLIQTDPAIGFTKKLVDEGLEKQAHSNNVHSN